MSEIIQLNDATMTTAEAAEKWKCSRDEVARWCKNDYIDGAEKLHGWKWSIPSGTMRPFDKKLIRELLWQVLELKNGSASHIDCTDWGISMQALPIYLETLKVHSFLMCEHGDARFFNSLAQGSVSPSDVRLTNKGLFALKRRQASVEAFEIPQVLNLAVTLVARFTAEVGKGLC